MTPLKKVAAVALTSLTLAIAFAPTAEAQYRRHGWGARPAPGYAVGGPRHHGWNRGGWHRGNGWNRGGMVAAGLLGGAFLGAALMPRPTYAAPVYQDCERELVGYTRRGRPVYETVCY
ncbi:MAG: hypothetical protein LCH61_18535 [Proteobacteria bacterium]|nr:hypothetical protein [Pseudomonadota bacterium]